MLRQKFFAHALELFFDSLDLLPRRGALLLIEIQCLGAGQPSIRAIQDRRRHLKIADEFAGGPGWRFVLFLPLGFEKQRGIVQDALADRSRSTPPGSIQLAGLACVAVMFGEDRRHALAVFQAVARRRDQKPHRHLRRDLACAHLLLNRFRQLLH